MAWPGCGVSSLNVYYDYDYFFIYFFWLMHEKLSYEKKMHPQHFIDENLTRCIEIRAFDKISNDKIKQNQTKNEMKK